MTKFRVTEAFLHAGDITIISQRGGGFNTFFCRFFMSHSTEAFVGEPFNVSIFSGIEKFCSQEGYISILCRNFSVS